MNSQVTAVFSLTNGQKYRNVSIAWRQRESTLIFNGTCCITNIYHLKEGKVLTSTSLCFETLFAKSWYDGCYRDAICLRKSQQPEIIFGITHTTTVYPWNNIHTDILWFVFFVVIIVIPNVIIWSFLLYYSWLLHWHRGNYVKVSVTVFWLWRIWAKRQVRSYNKQKSHYWYIHCTKPFSLNPESGNSLWLYTPVPHMEACVYVYALIARFKQTQNKVILSAAFKLFTYESSIPFWTMIVRGNVSESTFLRWHPK